MPDHEWPTVSREDREAIERAERTYYETLARQARMTDQEYISTPKVAPPGPGDDEPHDEREWCEEALGGVWTEAGCESRTNRLPLY